MGEVWAARDLRSDEQVAVKLPRASALADPDWRERLRREAEVLGRIRSPRVCKLLASGNADGVPFLVLEKLAGETLGSLVGRDGPLEWADVGPLGDQLFEALVAAHRAGVVHRDPCAGDPRTPPWLLLLDDAAARARAGCRSQRPKRNATI
jgi:serine/threonine-protein kinase